MITCPVVDMFLLNYKLFFFVIRSGFSFQCLPGGLGTAPCATSMGRAVYVYVDYVGIGQSGKWQSDAVRLEWFR